MIHYFPFLSFYLFICDEDTSLTFFIFLADHIAITNNITILETNKTSCAPLVNRKLPNSTLNITKNPLSEEGMQAL